MKRLEERAIRASINFSDNLGRNGIVKVKHSTKDNECIIEYKKRIMLPKMQIITEGTLHIVGDCFKVFGSNKDFVNYINKELGNDYSE